MIRIALLLLAAAGEQTDYFKDRVQPILQKHCLQCHNHELDDGNISFEDRATLLRDRPGGPAVVPGSPEKSVLVRVIHHKGNVQIPPGKKLAQKDIRTLIHWIKWGAPWFVQSPASKRQAQTPASQMAHLHPQLSGAETPEHRCGHCP